MKSFIPEEWLINKISILWSLFGIDYTTLTIDFLILALHYMFWLFSSPVSTVDWITFSSDSEVMIFKRLRLFVTINYFSLIFWLFLTNAEIIQIFARNIGHNYRTTKQNSNPVQLMQQPSSAVARWRLKIRLLTISIRCFMIDTLFGFPTHLCWLFRLYS